jgi:transposase
MKTKKGTKNLTEVLNLEGMKVYSYQRESGVGIILQIEPIKKESVCPRCGTKSHRLHQNHRYIVKDLPWGEDQVFLEINRRQFKCEKCEKPFSEKLDFVGRKRTYTKRLAKQIISEVLENDIHSIAKKGVVTTEEIERMLKDAASELLESKPLKLKRLGIDEIALVKGQGSYCAVLVDLESSKLLAILPSRKQEDIKKMLMGWGKEVLESIEEVSIDLWKGYKSLVEEIMPNAQIVTDRFHVMSQINQEEAQNYFPDSYQTIVRWLDEIIAYFDRRTTSGVVEGINNKLKLIKRSGYGFRNFENFRIRCLLNWHFNY